MRNPESLNFEYSINVRFPSCISIPFIAVLVLKIEFICNRMNMYSIAKLFLFKLKKTLFENIRVLYYKYGIKRSEYYLFFYGGIGDDLLLSSLAKLLKQQKKTSICILTRYPELFAHNPNIAHVITLPKYRKTFESLVKRLPAIFKEKFYQIGYAEYERENDRDVLPDRHIIDVMCQKVGVKYVNETPPEIYLNDKEKNEFRIAANQICIQSSGISSKSYMKNKDWFVERYNEVVKGLNSGTYTFVQIGSEEDPLIDGVVDMRGKTSIRQTASLLYNSKYFIGTVGFLMHLAKAVNCKSIIVYGGRELPYQSGYSSNLNLYSKFECSPCGFRNFCNYGRICMQNITVDLVLKNIN